MSEETLKQLTKEIIQMKEVKFLEAILAIITTYYPEPMKNVPSDLEIQPPENILMSLLLIQQRIDELERQNEIN